MKELKQEAIATTTVSHAKPKTQKVMAATKVSGQSPATTKKVAGAKRAAAKQVPLPLTPTATPSALVMMPLNLIETAQQVRTEFNDESLQELAQDIARRGVLQPVLLRPFPGQSNYLLIAGERWYRAAKLAGLADIPAIVGETDAESATEMQIAENIQREDLSLADTARVMRKVYEQANNSVTHAAAKLHKSKSWVSKHLSASCQNLHWLAKNILENGFTEDLEIVLTLDKLARLNFGKASDLTKLIEAGEAGRQSVRIAYDECKAEAEDIETERDARNTPEAKAEREAKQKEQEAEWKRQRDEREAQEKKDPRRLCLRITHDAQVVPGEREVLTSEQVDILNAHLGSIHAEGAILELDQAVKKISKMIYNGDYSDIEIAAFFLGITTKAFDLNFLINQVTAAIEEEEGA